MFQRARELRKGPTSAEKILWEALRNRKLGRFKFRRQHRFGFFIADFYCPEAKLIIEVDGEIHKAQTAHDDLRTQELSANGYQVIRFTNQQIIESLDQVLESITLACEKRTFAS